MTGLLALAVLVAGCAAKTPELRKKPGSIQRGIASYYGPGFHGRPTAIGEIFDQHAMTAAHPSLPFGTKVKVTNLENGRSVVLRINDRGPFAKRRIIDVSRHAAEHLGFRDAGVAKVRVEVI